MNDARVEHVKGLICAFVAGAVRSAAMSPRELPDDMDLRDEGILDSLGFVQLIAELERHLGERIDLAGLDAELLTNVGALTRHIANTTRLP